MAQYAHTEKMAAPADKVWAAIRGFGDSSWMGDIDITSEGEGVGAVRRIAMGGGTIVERCERLDDATRTLGYTIVEAPLPLRDYHSTMEIAEDGPGSTLTWSATYEPVGEPAEAENIVQQIYKGGARALKRYVEG